MSEEKKGWIMTRRRRPMDESTDYIRRITYNFNSMMNLNLEGLSKVRSNRSTRTDSTELIYYSDNEDTDEEAYEEENSEFDEERVSSDEDILYEEEHSHYIPTCLPSKRKSTKEVQIFYSSSEEESEPEDENAEPEDENKKEKDDKEEDAESLRILSMTWTLTKKKNK